MQQTRTAAPKNKAPSSVDALRNNATDFVVFQITRAPGQVKNKRLKRHVFGILRPSMEKRFKAFLKDPENKTFELTIMSWKDLGKFNSLLENSGLFKKRTKDVIGVKILHPPKEKPNADGSYDIKLRLVPKKLTLEQAKRLLGTKRTELLGLAKDEAVPKPVSTFKKPKLKASDHPMATLDLDGNAKENSEIYDLFGSSSEKGNANIAPKKVKKTPMKVKVLNAAKTRNVTLFPNAQKRNEFMASYEAGTEYSFEINGSSSFKTYFKNEMRKQDLDPARVKISKMPGKRWEVTLLKNTGRFNKKRAQAILRQMQW